jgi:CRISPR-associated endonuclease Csy4
MDHYVDIDLLSDPGFPPPQLMSALYSKLHRGLVMHKSTRIGVSFPGFNLKAPHLGTRLRLHGDLVSLAALLESEWLAGMRDHVVLALPARVPDTAQHCAVRRMQVKSSPERLRRRLMRRHNLDAQEAHERIPDSLARSLKLPFLQLRSASNGQAYRLFIDHGPAQANAVTGDFNTFGMSSVATIPWF